MIFSLVVRDKAALEITQAHKWYRLKSPGLEDKFIIAIEKQLEVLTINPFLFKKTYKFFREVSLGKFPFIVVYFVEEAEEMIIVVSVFHTSCNPRKKFK